MKTLEKKIINSVLEIVLNSKVQRYEVDMLVNIEGDSSISITDYMDPKKGLILLEGTKYNKKSFSYTDNPKPYCFRILKDFSEFFHIIRKQDTDIYRTIWVKEKENIQLESLGAERVIRIRGLVDTFDQAKEFLNAVTTHVLEYSPTQSV